MLLLLLSLAACSPYCHPFPHARCAELTWEYNKISSLIRRTMSPTRCRLGGLRGLLLCSHFDHKHLHDQAWLFAWEGLVLLEGGTEPAWQGLGWSRRNNHGAR